ncbi:hypothetical protein [Ornithinimicrobium kibberense]|uniref:hypothetical protein n=1 Tax=Ornithinimicrobium kibberense TaxID=282060 RepID=UPI0036181CE3
MPTLGLLLLCVVKPRSAIGACMTWRASWLQVVVATVVVGEGPGSCRFSAER